MRKRVHSAKSIQSSRRIAEARQIFVQMRQDLLAQLHEIEGILERIDSLPVSHQLDLKKSLEVLFETRDRAKPGSKEEELAAERILEGVFPDTNAG
jgi:hypothetical protein